MKQLAQLGNPPIAIIGGKDCEGVTTKPKHNEIFQIGSISVKSVHTPCHTQDSICYLMDDGKDKAVFTGDTLFIGGMYPNPTMSRGRTMASYTLPALKIRADVTI